MTQPFLSLVSYWARNELIINSKIDKKTILEALAGSAKAEKEIFKSFYGYVMSICLRYLSTREEAEETLNDVFLKVFKKLDQYDFSYPLKNWVRKIAVNSCIDHLRIKKRRFSFLRFDDYDLAQEDVPFELETDEPILPILQSLPPKYRAVFNLYVFEEYKHKEIAKLLGISEGTSKSNYARAKMILKKRLEEQKSISLDEEIVLSPRLNPQYGRV